MRTKTRNLGVSYLDINLFAHETSSDLFLTPFSRRNAPIETICSESGPLLFDHVCDMET